MAPSIEVNRVSFIIVSDDVSRTSSGKMFFNQRQPDVCHCNDINVSCVVRLSGSFSCLRAWRRKYHTSLISFVNSVYRREIMPTL